MQSRDEGEAAGSGTPSRSQRRREALDVLRLADALAGLSDAELARLPLGEETRGEVQRVRATSSHIARKRQLQYLAKHLRQLEPASLDPVRAKLAHARSEAVRQAGLLHRTEAWRERLLAEGDAALGALIAEFPQADRQRLRQLLRRAQAERAAAGAPHASRELHRSLRALLEADA